MKVVAIIPAWNEYTKLNAVVKRASTNADFVIVVDDGSKTPLSEHVQLPQNSVIIRHRINLGKGAALHTGIQYAKRYQPEYIVCLDGDDQHEPEDIPRFVERLENGKLDVVYGYRAIGKDMPLMMMLGNKFISLSISFLFGIYLSDTQCGFRAFRTAVYDKLAWKSPRYSVETEMIINAAKNKLRTGEVEIKTIYHDKYKGTTVLDGVRIFINILMWKVL